MNKRTLVLILWMLLLCTINTQAQVGINEDNSQPDASALLDVKSSDKGILIPRMSPAQRLAISNPAEGLLVYDSKEKSFWYFSTIWKQIKADNLGDHIALKNIQLNGQYLSGDGDAEGIFIDTSGLTGIGTNTPKEKLDVNGSIQLGDGNNPTPEAGAVRWNSTTQDFEGFIGDKWASLTYGNEIHPDSLVNDFDNHQSQQNSGVSGDYYGYAVDIGEEYAVIGAYSDDSIQTDAGAAYIFVKSGTNWIQQAKLKASDAGSGDGFGSSVSISGDYVIIGTYYPGSITASLGSAYIFTRSGTSWTEQAKLTASDAALNDYFGRAVSISGDYAIIGAFGNDDNGNSSGSAYIFTRSGISWTEQAKLTASDAGSGDGFGSSVSISEDYAIIGASGDDDKGGNSGSVYIFTRSGISWTEQAKLTASDGAASDAFGRSVSISGDYAIIGASSDDDKGFNSGSAYIFARSGTNWTNQAKLTASDGTAANQFGYSVSISGDYAVIGAFGNNNLKGAAYVFRRSGTNWTEQTKLIASNGASLDQFGSSVSIHGSSSLVGSIIHKAHFFQAGDKSSIFSSDSIYVANKGMVSLDNFMSKIDADNQDLSLSGNTLSLTNDASTVTLPWTTAGNDIYNSNTGNIGIGTNAVPTKAKLEISGSASYQIPNKIGYLNNSGGAGINNSPTVGNYSIYASNHIAAAAFNAHSDERIKNIKGISNPKNDLSILMQIEITNYQLRDTIDKGNQLIKKVIAQQVAKVYPQAVTNNLTEVVPDIYQRAEVENGWIVIDNDLKIGERVKIITETSNEIHKVIAVEDNRFKVNQLATDNPQLATVFVYGREVNDFHTVDYEAISMLNVSATQQLAKEVEQLKRENDALKAKVNQIDEMKAMLQALQQQINGETKIIYSED